MIININPNVIVLFFYILTFCLCFATTLRLQGESGNNLLLKQNNAVVPFLFCLFLIYFLGMRPVSGRFADMVSYARNYNNLSPNFADINWSTEWLFSILSTWCKKIGLTVNMYFLLLEFIYIGAHFYVCKKLLWENTWIAFLFCISAFSFLVYGVNGIRNGLGCAIMMAAIAHAGSDKTWTVAGLLALCALGFHRSTILPIAATVAALTFVRSPKMALWFWVASIPVSLYLGEYATEIFRGLGFDDRADKYLSGMYNNKGEGMEFSHTGFRWDFLLYSSMPVLLIYYVTVVKGIKDRAFDVLATVYLLTNAFWVMVIRASFSNRFAYLSWFIYPLILAYGFIRLPIWEDQDRKCGLALLAHASFTMLMFLIGKI